MSTHPGFDPIALQLGPLAIRWYGLMYLLAFLAFYLLGRWRIRHSHYGSRTGLTPADVEDLLFFGVVGVVLGGRLGYVLFYKPGYYLQHPLEAFAVWQGGMSFHGGLVGVLVACALFARRHRMRWLVLMQQGRLSRMQDSPPALRCPAGLPLQVRLSNGTLTVPTGPCCGPSNAATASSATGLFTAAYGGDAAAVADSAAMTDHLPLIL